MSVTQAKPDDGFDARLRSAYFDLGPEITDLCHMAAIARTLFNGSINDPDNGTGWRTLRITDEEFECLDFAISNAAVMARDLAKAYEKAVQEAQTERT
jgi:hypothetical protein